jgi:exodeoxyribonuclease VII small subunit
MAARTRANEFEKSFQQLEKIVQRLEGEELPLDESLQLFEEGIRLSRFCHQRLEEVEKKIELILADAKGQPRIEPFDEAESAGAVETTEDDEDDDGEHDSE